MIKKIMSNQQPRWMVGLHVSLNSKPLMICIVCGNKASLTYSYGQVSCS